MGNGALWLYCLSQSFVFTVIWFLLIGCFFRSYVNSRKWWFIGFPLVWLILTFLNIVIELYTATEKLYFLQAFLIPVGVSLGYWIFAMMSSKSKTK